MEPHEDMFEVIKAMAGYSHMPTDEFITEAWNNDDHELHDRAWAAFTNYFVDQFEFELLRRTMEARGRDSVAD